MKCSFLFLLATVAFLTTGANASAPSVDHPAMSSTTDLMIEVCPAGEELPCIQFVDDGSDDYVAVVRIPKSFPNSWGIANALINEVGKRSQRPRRVSVPLPRERPNVELLLLLKELQIR